MFDDEKEDNLGSNRRKWVFEEEIVGKDGMSNTWKSKAPMFSFEAFEL